MKAVVLQSFDGPIGSGLVVEDLHMPALKSGQALVKMAAAPINPSDLVFLKNLYGVKKPPPVVPGFEGSGTVMDVHGGGLYAKWLKGQRVACRAAEDGNGTWAEYMATDVSGCVPLLKDVTLDQGASLMVNPFTAWALLTIAQRDGHHAFMQTAAASALGRMMERLARRWHMISINVVRRREQVELMKKDGAVHVMDSSESGFDEQLRVLCIKHGVRRAFDAVGGELTARIAAAMPKGSGVVVYGALAGENCEMGPTSLIFEDKRLEGFWVTQWIKNLSFLKKMTMVTGVQKLIASDLATHVQARFPLDKIREAIDLYKTRRTDGKVLLIP